MGSEKTSTKQTQQYTPTEEERKLNQLQLSQAQEFDPMQRQLNQSGGYLVNQLLTGQALPGYLSGAMGVSEEQTQSMVDSSLRDLYPMFQSSGILDSGVAASIASRTSGDIRNQNAQFNVQSLQQLLNQAIGGQASVQAPMISTSSQLGSRLAGLRSGTGSQTVTGMNPFLKSFQTSMGAYLGGGMQSDAAKVAAAGCWVASEIFGGWYEPKTILSRFYVNTLAPKWFKSFYIRNGEKIAKFISDKPLLKLMLKPLFNMFVKIARKYNG